MEQDINTVIETRHCAIYARSATGDAQQLNVQVESGREFVTRYGCVVVEDSVVTEGGTKNHCASHLRLKIHRGQKCRVIEGYSSGSRTFGYRSKAVPDPTRPHSRGTAGILGHRLKIVESQAITIRRVFEMFADGLSVSEICTTLNKEKVPAARKPRIGSSKTAWNSNLIKRILQNTKYIGINVWGKTYQVRHPITGKLYTYKKPAEEWVYAEIPEIRIIPQELWIRVQDRLLVVNVKLKTHLFGGSTAPNAKTTH